MESQLLIIEAQSRQRESADFPRHFTQNRPERPVIRDGLVTHTGARPSRTIGRRWDQGVHRTARSAVPPAAHDKSHAQPRAEPFRI